MHMFVAEMYDGDCDRLTLATLYSGFGHGTAFGQWDISKCDVKQRPGVCLPTGGCPPLLLLGTLRPLCEEACASRLEDETKQSRDKQS